MNNLGKECITVTLHISKAMGGHNAGIAERDETYYLKHDSTLQRAGSAGMPCSEAKFPDEYNGRICAEMLHGYLETILLADGTYLDRDDLELTYRSVSGGNPCMICMRYRLLDSETHEPVSPADRVTLVRIEIDLPTEYKDFAYPYFQIFGRLCEPRYRNE